MDSKIYATRDDVILKGEELDRALESGAPVLIPHPLIHGSHRWTPEQKARALVNHGFRHAKKYRKGRKITITNGSMRMSIRGKLREAFEEILPHFE